MPPRLHIAGMDSDYEYEYDDDDDFPESDEEMASGDDYEFDAHADMQTAAKKAPYIVYNEAELRERQQRAVDDVTGVLSVDKADVVRVLREYKWDAARLQEEWFTDTVAVRDKAGLMERSQPASTSGKDQCKICFDDYSVKEMRSAACNHRFCKACWKGYVNAKTAEGPAVLNLRCPLPNCRAAVPQSIVTEVASEADRKKYASFALRSFVEDNRQLTWCPSPGCENAVEAKADVGNEPLDIACKCGAAFCFQCTEEAHRPVDCETVHRWMVKNSAESENLNWILAHTKQCPKCKRPIEKNQGCMHMTCSQCRFEFCWLCQGSWAEHGERTGGFYNCNRYEVGRKKGEYDEETLKREQAKNALERYMHYYQRWAENDKARLSALEAMNTMIEKKLEEISEMTATPSSQLKFLSDAWAQVVDCRRILKWTYAYGYYRFAEAAQAQTSAQASANAEALKQQQEFFEFNQGQAEYFLEKLHGMAEKQVGAFLDGTESAEGWPKFRENLIGLTDVTRTHFDKLVSELERGLDTMLDAYGAAGSHLEQPGEAQGPSAPQPAVGTRKKPARPSKKPRGAAAASKVASQDDLEALAHIWQCVHCTLANPLGRNSCSACGNARGSHP